MHLAQPVLVNKHNFSPREMVEITLNAADRRKDDEIIMKYCAFNFPIKNRENTSIKL